MKASELIEDIQKIIEERGDLPVFIYGDGKLGEDSRDVIVSYQSKIEISHSGDKQGFHDGIYIG